MMATEANAGPSPSDIRYFFFRHRDHIPIPVAIAALVGLWFYHPDFAANSTAAAIVSGVASGVLILIGELLRIWSVGYSGTTTRAKSLKARALATGGPYSFSRNPIYLGNFMLGLGFVLIPRVWWLVAGYVIFFAIQYSLIVSIEEQFLAGKFGEEYAEYKRRVPRFGPSPRGFVSSLESGGFDAKALRGEKWTLLNMLVVGVGLFALNYWLRSR